jgi:hypothetical protein
MSVSFTPHSESGRNAPQSQQSLTFKAPAGSTASFDLRKTLGTNLPSAGVTAVPAATVVATAAAALAAAAAPAAMFSPSAAAAAPKTDFLNAFGSIGLSAALDCLPAAIPAQQQQQQQQPVVSSARALLEAKRARREAEAAAEAALPPRSSIAAAGSSSSAKQSGAMSYQAALGQKDLDALQQDEHHLKGMSKTKANASSKQKRRGRDGCKKGEQYEERKAGKVSKKETRTNRMAVLKHMY